MDVQIREFLVAWLGSLFPDDERFIDRLFQATAINAQEDIPAIRPLVVYRMGGFRPITTGDDEMATWIQPVQIFVHDVPGDFGLSIEPTAMAIGFACGKDFTTEVAEAFPHITRTALDYVSEDSWDKEWGTAVKYARIEIYGVNPELRD